MNPPLNRIVRRACALIAVIAFAGTLPPARGAEEGAAKKADGKSLFARENLVAWCIVPFDKAQRTPAERAQMLAKMGVKRLAYDWRDQHLPTWDEELDQLKKHGIELTALWFPAGLNEQARVLLDGLERHKVTTQLWVSAGIEPGNDQAKGVQQGADLIRPIAKEAARIGSTVALYNHGGWFGEPENQIQIVEKLKAEGVTNVGIVYNLHHGHDHLDRFPAMLEKMKPYLMALNLNGMTKGGDKVGKKILPIGQGDLDLQLLKTIRDSGYTGPIGILNHTDEDAEGRLLDNVEGLEWLVPQLEGKAPAGPRPTPRTWTDPAAPAAPAS
jgi:sugar phosphate isomerase/epimerase